MWWASVLGCRLLAWDGSTARPGFSDAQYGKGAYSFWQPFLPLLALLPSVILPCHCLPCSSCFVPQQPWMWRTIFTPRHCHKRQGTLVVVPVCGTPFVSNTEICIWRIGLVISSVPKWTYLVPLNQTSINFITILSILPSLPWFGHVTPGVCICGNLCAIWQKWDTFGHVCYCHLYLSKSILQCISSKLASLYGHPGDFLFFKYTYLMPYQKNWWRSGDRLLCPSQFPAREWTYDGRGGSEHPYETPLPIPPSAFTFVLW